MNETLNESLVFHGLTLADDALITALLTAPALPSMVISEAMAFPKFGHPKRESRVELEDALCRLIARKLIAVLDDPLRSRIMARLVGRYGPELILFQRLNTGELELTRRGADLLTARMRAVGRWSREYYCSQLVLLLEAA